LIVVQTYKQKLLQLV